MYPEIYPKTKKDVFTNSTAHPLLLDMILLKQFGPEYIGWEPETLWSEIESTFGAAPVSAVKNKIQAVRTAYTSDQPYETWNVFEKIAIALDGDTPFFDLMQKPTAHEAATAISILNKIKGTKITEEVYKYVASILLEDGFVLGLDLLEPCNKYILKFIKKDLFDSVLNKSKAGNFKSSETDTASIQALKSKSVSDYVEANNRALLMQIEFIK